MIFSKDELLGKIENKRIIIYGAHLVALEVYRFIKDEADKKNILGFAVTFKNDNPDSIEGLKVQLIDEYEVSEDIAVIIAMPKKYHAEIENSLKVRGYRQIIAIDQEAAEIIKKEIILDDVSKRGGTIGEFSIYEDENDKSWLNAIIADNSEIKMHIKIPTLYYQEKEYLYTALKQTGIVKKWQDIFRSCDKVQGLRTLKDSELTNLKSDDFKIYMVYSEWDNGNRQERDLPYWIAPIQAGSAIAKNIVGDLRDNEGENISALNRSFAELTVSHWIWKNDNKSRYKGMCHYRRHFVLSEKNVHELIENDVDVVLTTPRFAPGGVKEMFVNETPVKPIVFGNLEKAIKELYPEEFDAFSKYVNDEFYCPNNMVVAKNEIYNDYCEWMFSVLFRLLEIDAEINYGHETDRHPAYAAELLTSYYFASRSKNLKICYVDYRFM